MNVISRVYHPAAVFPLVLAIVATTSPGARAADPSADELTQQANRCHQLLLRSVVDFYLPHCVDTQHGGYLEVLDDSGNFAAGEDKFLTLQARQLWLMSILAQHDVRPDQSLAAAKSGYQFLQQAFHDREHGGYFSSVTNAGDPLDRRKHVYLNSFALYGLVAYHRATKDPAALEAALDLFRLSESKAHDKQHGGYQEFFDADWTPITDASQSGYIGAINTKTYNSHLHLMESFADLYRVSPSPLLAQRLHELLIINTHTVRHPGFACNIDGWTRDWKMITTTNNLRASYGHDIECAWLVLDAAGALGLPADLLGNWAVSLVDYSLDHGYDRRHGGFFYTGPPGGAAKDRHKEWWVQSEGLVSMLEMYRVTGEDRYYDAFVRTLDFVEQHQIAGDQGGWWASRNKDGSASANRSRTSRWHGGYHNGRALLLCTQRLKDLASGRQ